MLNPCAHNCFMIQAPARARTNPKARRRSQALARRREPASLRLRGAIALHRCPGRRLAAAAARGIFGRGDVGWCHVCASFAGAPHRGARGPLARAAPLRTQPGCYPWRSQWPPAGLVNQRTSAAASHFGHPSRCARRRPNHGAGTRARLWRGQTQHRRTHRRLARRREWRRAINARKPWGCCSHTLQSKVIATRVQSNVKRPGRPRIAGRRAGLRRQRGGSISAATERSCGVSLSASVSDGGVEHACGEAACARLRGLS